MTASSGDLLPQLLRLFFQVDFVTVETGGYGEEATVIGGGLKTDAYHAAFINGAAAHALDYDDVLHLGRLWAGHPSAAIFPAVLAVAEKVGASGRELILAYCLGIEVYAKVSLLCGDTPHANGWHNTPYKGTMAAAAAVARLLRLDDLLVRRTFGIAASLAGGLRQNFGTMTKPLHAGIAARNGVEAASLAQAGITANEEVFEAPLGFRKVFTGEYRDISVEVPYGDTSLTPAELAARLGNPWNVVSPGLSFKVCPSCRATHFGMEAALDFREKMTVDAERISEVVCHVPNHMESVLFHHNPRNGLEGKFSLEYVLARTLLDGLPKVSDFSDERVNEEQVRGLMEKIKWHSFAPDAGTFGVPEFVIRLDDGTCVHTRVESPRGDPENPVSDDMLMAKYEDCARSVLSPPVVDQLRDTVMSLESLEAVPNLADLLLNGCS